MVLVASGSAGSAFLNNMTLTHGSIAGSAGGLLLYGPTTLDGVTVSNNAATNGNGGGIYATTGPHDHRLHGIREHGQLLWRWAVSTPEPWRYP